jgi:tRNA dimethylallyltransferase
MLPGHQRPRADLYGRALLLAGPTAVGKSEVALILAERLDAEIASVDSMQVYRGMDIGTAKPDPAERVRVHHHLIDVAELTVEFSVAQFVQLASGALADIQERGRCVILCGGTGLYFKALLEGMGTTPPPDAALRKKLEAMPLPELLLELERADPATYAVMDRKNPRRVIRAVEIIRLSGKPVSSQIAAWSREKPGLIVLSRSPEDMRARIEQRVDEMFRRGLVAETERLLQHGLDGNKTARQALGYRQVIEHLRGQRSLEETIEQVKTRTRQFAKRQMTWFRNQFNPRWIHIAAMETAGETATRVQNEAGFGQKPGE